MSPEPSSRRPLTSRNRAWARALAAWAVRRGLTPNAISIAAIGFAAVGGGSLALSRHFAPAALCLLAAACCQARLICNLIDGMVAIEGGKGAKDGPFWNEAPDRLSDLLLLAGAGGAAGQPALGLLAAALAIATAYLRELGRAEGLPPDFGGPMAKPQRMAALTVGALLAALATPYPGAPGLVLRLVLWVIVLGALVTLARRSARLIAALKAK